MARILCIDTATKACSVAICEGGECVDSKLLLGEKYGHAENLHKMILAILKTNDWLPTTIEAVAVSKGPGSYTGLRIGVSAAKGMCFALNIPLIAIGTLRVLCENATVHSSDADLYCPMIDARRNEVYTAIYDRNGREVRPVEAMILEDHSFDIILDDQRVAFFGDGAAKFRDQLSHANALFIDDVVPEASSMCALAHDLFLAGNFVDVAYFEPFYLKDFIAGKPKKALR